MKTMISPLRRPFFCFARIILAVCLAAPLASFAGPIRTLIVDGQNNHKWAETTPILVEILNRGDLFSVDVATSPPKGEPMDGFAPNFSDYDVVVSNYNGAMWPESTQKAFLDFVRGGGGFVVVHAADNSFSEWPEYNEIIGLGGWGGRNEKDGPYLRLRDGKFERDMTPGKGGTHGPQRPFAIEIRDTEHPITKGLPEVWMHAQDELYAKLRGPAKNLTVLATALSKPKEGEPENEPMLFTIEYGEGRVFHTTLGHYLPAMRCAGFAFTLRRGTEWAATGKVTQTQLPDNFPSATEVSLDEANS